MRREQTALRNDAARPGGTEQREDTARPEDTAPPIDTARPDAEALPKPPVWRKGAAPAKDVEPPKGAAPAKDVEPPKGAVPPNARGRRHAPVWPMGFRPPDDTAPPMGNVAATGTAPPIGIPRRDAWAKPDLPVRQLPHAAARNVPTSAPQRTHLERERKHPARLWVQPPGPKRAERTPATAVPGWAERPAGRQSGRRRPAVGRRYQIAGLVALIVAAIIAGAVTVALSGHRAKGATPGGREGAAAARSAGALTRGMAAAWVARQVSRTAVVSCDPVMCSALSSHGVPASDLDRLGPQTISPLASAVIVATSAVRAQFGNLLSTVYAPAVLARFGSGILQIDIREIAPHGAAAYRSALHADLLDRKASGGGLLLSSRITASATARQELSAGQADSRLIITIAGMASVHPLYIVAFSGAAPGAGAGMPLRFAEVTEVSHAHHKTSFSATPAFLRSMSAFVRGQSARLGAPHAQAVRLTGGEIVLRIEFGAPSPLGLLGPQGP